MNWEREQWEIDTAQKWPNEEIDKVIDLDGTADGWIMTVEGRWQSGQISQVHIDSDPYYHAFRVYEYASDAIESLAPYCERVEMTQIARIRLSGKVYRPARRACPYRAFQGAIAECLWVANPSNVFHDFALQAVQDIVSDYPSLSDFIAVKQEYLTGGMTWQSLDSVVRKLDRLRWALGSDGRHAARQVLLCIGLEHRNKLEWEQRLESMLLTLAPEVIP